MTEGETPHGSPGVTRGWLAAKAKSYGLPGLVLGFLFMLLRAQLGRLSAETAAFVMLAVSLPLVFGVLTFTTLLYVINRLLNEISRISESRDKLERVLLERRLSTNETKKEDA